MLFSIFLITKHRKFEHFIEAILGLSHLPQLAKCMFFFFNKHNFTLVLGTATPYTDYLGY